MKAHWAWGQVKGKKSQQTSEQNLYPWGKGQAHPQARSVEVSFPLGLGLDGKASPIPTT